MSIQPHPSEPPTATAAPIAPRAGRSRAAPVALALAVLAAACRFAPGARTPFFADDHLFLEQVRGRSLFGALSSPDPLGNFLRPLSRPVWFWSLSAVFGDAPLAFHLAAFALFVVIVVLVHRITARLAGPRAGIVAACYLATHEAFDVPLRWCAGSQDLLATAAGLGVVLATLAGRRLLAAALLAAALLSKETAAVVPVVAVGVAWCARGDARARLREAWPLGVVLAAWAAVWLATASVRTAADAELGFGPASAPAAFAHLAQVAAGLELPWGVPHVAALAAVLAAALAAFAAFTAAPRPAPQPPVRGAAAWTAAGWACAGALPVVAVAHIWSAYFYVFALCGVAVALGVALARVPRVAAMACIAALAFASAATNAGGAFATGRTAWAMRSHVNDAYVRTVLERSGRYRASLRRALPAVAPGTTILFAELAPYAGFQAGDGALLRAAYREPTLRSYTVGAVPDDGFGPGPVRLFAGSADTLVDHTADPAMLPSVAYSLLLDGRYRAAAAVLDRHLHDHPGDAAFRIWAAWCRYAAGDPAGAQRMLARAGCGTRPAPAALLQDAGARVAAGDTAAALALLRPAARAHARDAAVHARLAALLLARSDTRADGVVEAVAVIALDPRAADGWRKLASGQLAERRYAAAEASLQRYFELGGAAARGDAEAVRTLTTLEAIRAGAVAGGD